MKRSLNLSVELVTNGFSQEVSEVEVKNLFQRTIARETVATPPIWMMRQAGRYHSHYQALKKNYSFMNLCLHPELAAEVAMGPVLDFDFDAAILFSDILFPLKALGMPLDYTDTGPQLGFQLTAENILNLKPAAEAAHEMIFQKEAMQITRSRLSPEKGLIGFVGGPWTLFVYAMEGTHSGNLIQSKTHWPLWQQFAPLITDFLIENIKLQFQGGADVVMILDTAAGEVSPFLFQNHIQPYLKKMASAFPQQLGYYSKGTSESNFNEEFKTYPFAGQGFDHRHDLSHVLKNANGFTQGNFDQSLLFLPSADFKKVFSDYLQPLLQLSSAERKGWICGLGHGILPKTPEENVRSFIEIVRKNFK